MKRRILRDIVCASLWVIFAIIVMSVLYSCRQGGKREHPKALSQPAAVQEEPAIRSKLSIFDLDLVGISKGDTVGFISVSDVDSLSRKVDSLVIPDLKDKKPEETQFFTLKSRYRKRLLKSTGILETDSLFVYDYSKDELLRFPIRSLNAVASLSIYETVSEVPHSEADYQLGFKIDRALLAGLNDKYLSQTLVYIGADNPFTKGQMHRIIWDKADPKKIPFPVLDSVDARQLKGFRPGNTYSFGADGFHYYLQEFLSGEKSVSERLMVTNPENKMVFNELYYENESVSPAPLSFAGDSKNEFLQWTGRLFKNRPPVILGFEFVSFGCEDIPSLDGHTSYVDLKCDNRH